MSIQAVSLVKAMMKDKEINFAQDWKVAPLFRMRVEIYGFIGSSYDVQQKQDPDPT